MRIYLIRGFKGHGKSTFAKKMGYPVYSFASELKKQVYTFLEEKGCDPSKYEKEQILPVGYQENGCKTLRDYFKYVAAEVKKSDPFHWVRKTFEQITEDVAVIDDWRFMEEYNFLKHKNVDIITIRIFCESAKIPSIEDSTEHALDGIFDDFEVIR